MAEDSPNLGVGRFSEGLAFELKPWLDPARPEHRIVLVGTLIALRNHGGGTLLVGVRDDGLVRTDDPGFDIVTAYHGDQVQELVSRHSSETFSVTTSLLTSDGNLYVRMDVEPGISTPVRVKTAITFEHEGNTKRQLRVGEIPVRTLESNGRPSTADCTAARDWERLMSVCFDNREADIGRFIRRHLRGAGPALAEMIDSFQALRATDTIDGAAALLDLGNTRFQEEMAVREFAPEITEMIGWGGREVALQIQPPPEGFSANGIFLQRLLSSVPRLTAYPPLLDASIGGPTSGFQVRLGRWEGLLAHHELVDALSFEMADPKGQFYERRLLLPDVVARHNKTEPKSALGERQAITDVAEVIITGLAFASALFVADERHELVLAFRWRGLAGRLIDEWFSGSRADYRAEDDISPICRLTIAADTPQAALAAPIGDVMRPMFEIFRGYMSSQQQIEETLAEVIERRSRY